MPSEKYEFKGADGQLLVGNIELPEEEISAYAVFAHCFTCSKDFVASRTIAKALAARSIATLRFDFTGLGNSEGDFSNTNFSSNTQDLVAAANSLAQTHGAPKIMIGHSLGGAATLAASGQLPSVKAVATIAAPFDPGHVEHLFANHLDDINTSGLAEVNLFGRKFTIKKEFIEDIKAQNSSDIVAQLRKPLLVMHSPTDSIVNINNAKEIFERARHPKSYVSLDNIDHLLTKKKDADYVASILAVWASRYI